MRKCDLIGSGSETCGELYNVVRKSCREEYKLDGLGKKPTISFSAVSSLKDNNTLTSVHVDTDLRVPAGQACCRLRPRQGL